jgi:quaternary ammonium compound-resistance protein SugE
VAWFLLVVAGLLEVVWAALLPATGGFRQPWPTAGFLLALSGSMALLGKAAATIPLGTAYAVWVGIGVVGTVLVGVVAHGDPPSPLRFGFLALLLVAIVGLKVTSH